MAKSSASFLPGHKTWNRGNGRIDNQGYRRIYVNGHEVREHRIVAEQVLGRPLASGETVHHKNGVRSDNSPSNLQIYPSHSSHMKEHMTTDEARRRGRMTKRSRRAALAAVGYTEEA